MKNQLARPDKTRLALADQVSLFLSISVAIISVASLSGWALGLPAIAAWGPDLKPMAADVAFILTALSAAAASLVLFGDRGWPRLLAICLGLAVVAYCVTKVLSYPPIDWKDALDAAWAGFEYPKTLAPLMSPLAGYGLALAGSSIALGSISPQNKLLKRLSDSLAALSFTLGFITAIGYLYGTPFLYGLGVAPIALPAGVCLMLFASASIGSTGIESGLRKIFFGSHTEARLVRAFVPFIAFLTLLTGWFFNLLFKTEGISRSSLPNPALVGSALSVASIFLAVSAISLVSRWIGKRLDQAQAELRISYLKLDAFWEVASMEDTNVRALCDHILVSIVKMTESRFGFFGFVGEDETAMTIHAWSGEAMKGCSIADKPSRFPIADAGVWGEAVRRREPFILNDYGKYHSAKKGLPAGHVPLSRLMVVPIFSSGKIVSLAAVANRDRDYGADDVKQLKAFGESVQSIIDRKGAQADLAAEKERLAVTLRSIGDGVITTDIAGLVTEMNGVAESLTGWTRREAAGRPLAQVFNIINEYTREICENPVERVLSTGKVIELANHTLLVARDGTERVIADSGAPIKDAEGKVLGVVLVFRDTTEKQRLMESAQRTEKLEALSVLAGGIAHDFNNLLEGVFGYVGLARDSSSASPEVVARLDKALGVSERAKALTRQLLTFSKGGAPERKNVALGALLREASAFALAGTAIEREFEIPEGLWPCLGDRYQLGQVIDNIVINAREAMPGGGKITIRAANVSLAQGQKPRMAPGDYVMVSIRDSGTGIAPEEAKRVFDPFYTTKDKGTGLGLAVCHSIILKHEGTVELESRPGEGTEIRFYLPRSSQEGQAEAASSSRTSTSARTTAQGSGSVLVMDDEEFIREILSDILSGMGYTPIEAANGAQALEICRGLSTGGPGLSAAVLDLTVPGGLGGKAIIKELRAAYPRLPVFAASGYSEDPVIARPWEFGFTDSIRKPFDRAELARMFAKHLGTDKAGAVETGGDHDR